VVLVADEYPMLLNKIPMTAMLTIPVGFTGFGFKILGMG